MLNDVERRELNELRAAHKSQRQVHQDAMNAIVAKADGEGRTNLTAAEDAEWREHDKAAKELDRSVSGKRGAGVDTRGMSGSMSAEERAFDAYLRHGIKGPELRTTYDAGMNESGFQSSGTAGGFLVPQAFLDQLTIRLKAFGGYAELLQAGEYAYWCTDGLPD